MVTGGPASLRCKQAANHGSALLALRGAQWAAQRGNMTETSWTDAYLDGMRQVGDSTADRVIGELFERGDVDTVNALMRTLVENDGLPSQALPEIVRDYLDTTAELPPVDPSDVGRAQELFGLLGPEILAVLGFYSLPADYAAKKGVQVLYRTGRLTAQPIRRVFETTQMVVDVMAPGGLGAHGRGLRDAQKVRLMHAAVRHLLLSDRKHPWDQGELGIPINQEDLAGTLMSFGFLVPEGLRALGVTLADADRDAYFRTWMAIGRIMGIDPELIPSSFEDARKLTGRIHQRQIAESEAGRVLAAALVEGYRGLLPKPLHGFPVSLIRLFLDHDPFTGQNIADLLGLPPTDWTRHLERLLIDFDHILCKLEFGHALTDKVVSYASRKMIEGMLLVERGGKRAPFLIPDALQHRWGLADVQGE